MKFTRRLPIAAACFTAAGVFSGLSSSIQRPVVYRLVVICVFVLFLAGVIALLPDVLRNPWKAIPFCKAKLREKWSLCLRCLGYFCGVVIGVFLAFAVLINQAGVMGACRVLYKPVTLDDFVAGLTATLLRRS